MTWQAVLIGWALLAVAAVLLHWRFLSALDGKEGKQSRPLLFSIPFPSAVHAPHPAIDGTDSVQRSVKFHRGEIA